MSSQEYRDLLAGEINSQEYVRIIKQQTDERLKRSYEPDPKPVKKPKKGKK